MGAAPDALRRGSLGLLLKLLFRPPGTSPRVLSTAHWAAFLLFIFAISGLRLPLLIVPTALLVSLGSFSHLFPFSFLSYLL